MAPARISSRSESVLLPWSIWAMIEKLRICITLRVFKNRANRPLYGRYAPQCKAAALHYGREFRRLNHFRRDQLSGGLETQKRLDPSHFDNDRRRKHGLPGVFDPGGLVGQPLVREAANVFFDDLAQFQQSGHRGIRFDPDSRLDEDAHFSAPCTNGKDGNDRRAGSHRQLHRTGGQQSMAAEEWNGLSLLTGQYSITLDEDSFICCKSIAQAHPDSPSLIDRHFHHAQLFSQRRADVFKQVSLIGMKQDVDFLFLIQQ